MDALLAVDVVIENPEESFDKWRLIGRPLEKNITIAAAQLNLPVQDLIKKRISILPFNSTNKFSVAYDEVVKEYIVFGAPDILLNRSNISKEDFILLENQITILSSQGKRLLGVARFKSDVLHTETFSPTDVINVSFSGVLVLYDPVRPEAKEAVERIENHGARVVMITGDLKGTALCIARELGWQVDEGMVITGDELRGLSDDELKPRLSHIKIFSRVTPEDKLRVGMLFQSVGEIVAMTGDGVNDAPALKAVDIGIALGSGSDVAKGVADLVLLDDNFQTIVLAIEEGRRIIANIRKSFVYLMSNCFDEVVLIGGSLLIGLPLPLSALQIIWVNFFTGSLPALSYAFEENRDIGKHSSKVEKTIFNREVRVLTLGVGVFSSLLLFVFYWVLLRVGTPLDIARTVLFLSFSSYILVICFCFKSLHRPLFSYPLFDNHSLNISVLVASVLLIISCTWPPLYRLLDIIPIHGSWILLVVAWLVFNVLLVEAIKWGFRVSFRRRMKS